MKELKVENVIISKQGKISENYKVFEKIANNKKINVIIVNKGDKLKIDKSVYIEFLWPNNSNFITENTLNNNSIVCKIYYNNFSCLFTGDVEEIAEKEIIKEYKNNLKILKSDILKVAHHGSKTSSIQEFLQMVNPKIALIGVGEKNKFGHPDEDVIMRLKELKCYIYRTDEFGEIVIFVNKKGRLKVKKFIE